MNFDDVLKKPKHCAYNEYYSKTIFGNIGKSTMEPRSTRVQEVQVNPMQQALQSKYQFEDPLSNSDWGKNTEVHTLQLLSQSRC